MKKVVENFIRTYGLETGYSGSLRIMYIKKGEKANEALRTVREKWPNLAFYVRITEDIPTEAKEELGLTFKDGKLESVHGDKEHTLVNKMNAIPITKVEDEFAIATVVADKEETKRDKEKLRADVDAYLLNNPIDKSQKGFFVPIAEKFNCTSDYIRKRYNSLKERNLIPELQTV